MIKSMTGFGKAETSVENRKIVVEVRSLNSRQLDIYLRMPHLYRSLEADVRSAISDTLQRGKVDIFVNIEEGEGAGGVVVNKKLFADYYSQLKEVAKESGMRCDTEEFDAQLLRAIMRMPEVVSSDVEEIDEAEGKALVAVVKEAVAELDKFRLTEGKVLITDMLERVAKIEEYLEQVTPYEQQRVDEIRERIIEGIESIGASVDENRLEQELVYYVEKLDVTEERVRLSNHCNYFREVATTEEGVGRKLNFISQEMGREINTLGSKANHSAIQHIVVKMKDEHEKIKEQLLNIL